jgi:hypothetical protein
VPPGTQPGREGLPRSYAEALALEPRVALVAGCDVNPERRAAFGQRYGVTALHEEHRQLLAGERLDLVALCGRAAERLSMIEAAVAAGVRIVLAEKPLCHTLAEADRIVDVCRQAGVTLTAGTHFASHPAFDVARDLLAEGVIGHVLSAEVSPAMHAQNNAWLRLAEAAGGRPQWAIGLPVALGDPAAPPPTAVTPAGTTAAPPTASGAAPAVVVATTATSAGAAGTFAATLTDAATSEDGEFEGEGVIQFERGLRVFMRRGAPFLRLTGERGELVFGGGGGFRLWLDVEGAGRRGRAEVPFPGPNVLEYPSPLYTAQDALRCHERSHERGAGQRDGREQGAEPRVSGRRARWAMEVEIALRESSRRGGATIALPLDDRSLGMRYAWFR